MASNQGQPYNMPRALLTDAERRAVRGDEDMTQNNRSSHLSRVRRRMDDMATDAELLREYRPELYERLHESVCEEDIDERVAALERQVRELRNEGDDAP